MWIVIALAFAIAVGLLGALLGGGPFTIIGLPIAVVLAVLITAVYVRRGTEAPQVVDRTEPTGTPRAASADAETANERVGQA
jgi:membrane protein implicated in regulation of membrane protease activity